MAFEKNALLAYKVFSLQGGRFSWSLAGAWSTASDGAVHHLSRASVQEILDSIIDYDHDTSYQIKMKNYHSFHSPLFLLIQIQIFGISFVSVFFSIKPKIRK